VTFDYDFVETSAAMREPDWISRAIAVMEIIGGAVGAVLVCIGLRASGGQGWFFGLVMLIAYVWCIVAGVKLWRQRPDGWWHSIFVQALQIPWIVTRNLSYLFCAGLGVWYGLGSNGAIKSRAIGGRFDLGWATGFGPQFDARPWHVAFNVVAVAAAGYLVWSRRTIVRREREDV
jgi:hypothetical protein